MLTKPTAFQVWKKAWFGTPLSTVVTLVVMGVVGYVLWALYGWGVRDAVWTADPQVCQEASGACWGFVREKWRLIVFGRYPLEEQWRPVLATCLIVGLLVITAIPRFWHGLRARLILLAWVVVLVLFFGLMYGGWAGLAYVSTDFWGGLPLTVVLTLIGMGASIPIGVLLALGRRSHLPVLRYLSTLYIEVVRGVPLITVLFVATFVIPLFLPKGLSLDPFWRVAIGLVLFQAAYIAETVRGGLQTIPKGQFMAAKSLGFSPWHQYTRIILPQALVAVIPAFVNSLISNFMDTSLVTVVSMYDLTGSLRLALGDTVWRAFFLEGYAFIVAIYFIVSFIVSRYSFWLERYITGHRQGGINAR